VGWGSSGRSPPTGSRIPAFYEWGSIAKQGGSMAYGPVIAELDRRVAFYVDRILKCAKPADLPIEQPRKFEHQPQDREGPRAHDSAVGARTGG